MTEKIERNPQQPLPSTVSDRKLASPTLTLSQSTIDHLRCPVCGHPLVLKEHQFICQSHHCARSFPVINNTPILLHEQASIFSIDDFVAQRPTTFDLKENKLKNALSNLLPKIDRNLKAEQNYSKMVDLLLHDLEAPQVLVIGCGNLGKGMTALAKNSAIDLLETDVSWGNRTQIICDAHNLPFADAVFDGVIIQAVLEHVVDPYRCVAEIHRVLKHAGIVYAETPFMQQVHMGCYDFTRFTHLGHRRLFRQFDEIESGAANGPGTALAWSYQYFLLSFFESKILRKLTRAFARLTSFYLQYFDYLLLNKPGAFDAASGYYFMGRKGEDILDDRDLLTLYRGGISFGK